jgi:hypothetical protein
VLDSEVDLVSGPNESLHPIPREQLRVFPSDSDIPKDARNARIDDTFVPVAKVEVPEPAEFQKWRASLLQELRTATFNHFPPRIPAAQPLEDLGSGTVRIATEQGISIHLRATKLPGNPRRVLLLVANPDSNAPIPGTLEGAARDGDALYTCEPRGWGSTRWTRKNPPNYVERSHYLLGRTADSGRVWDIAATARYLKSLHRGAEVHLLAHGTAAGLAIYAALLEPDIAALTLHEPPATHNDPAAPVLLNVLRICDLPDALGMLAPRSVTITGQYLEEPTRKAARIYEAAGVPANFKAAP